MFSKRLDPAAWAGACLAAACALVAVTWAAPVLAQESADAAVERADSAGSSSRVSFDIPAQELGPALVEFGQQSGQELLYSGEAVAGKSGNAVQGSMSRREAMAVLLEGTGLEFDTTPSGGMIVGDRATLDARRAEWESSATGVVDVTNTVGQRQPGIEEIIVTGQKREERIQDVPIAISAFSPEDLEAQKIEGGFDLLKGVPNVTFSKTNFAGYNFQIRGIGTQAVSATTDPGVAVSFNNTTLIVNRLFEQEYLDVERVEVLRGPQGTLFGRNATAGVINVLSNKPEMGIWDGMIDVEVGNYNTRRLRGFFNAPLGDEFAIRGAYASTKRDGFGINLAADEPDSEARRDVDGRDLWTGRLTLGWQPTDRFRADLIWERFEEDDNRVRTSKQLCHHDPGRESAAGVNFEDHPQGTGALIRPLVASQGCLPGSMYSDDAYGMPNGTSLPFVGGQILASTFLNFGFGFRPSLLPGVDPQCELETSTFGVPSISLCTLDPYGNRTQSRDLRTIVSKIEPQYRAEADIFHLTLEHEWTDELLLTSETVYVSDSYYASQDFNRFTTLPLWSDSSTALSIRAVPGAFADLDGDGVGFYANLTPGGVFCDPQLGCSDTLVAQDLIEAESRQYNQELRLVSAYGGDWNFSLGANYTRFRTRADYYVFANALTLFTHMFPFNWHESDCIEGGTLGEPDGLGCVYVDPNPLDSINGEGHNYFRSANPYKLTSSAVFGELYWNAAETVKVTAGLRFTWDRKVFTPIPSQLLLRDYREVPGDGKVNFLPEGASPEECVSLMFCTLAGNAVGGRGSPANPDIVQEWYEPTGRLVVDWQPVLDWTDESLFYGSFSRGYKGGGANPPSIAPPAGLFIEAARGGAAPKTFEPEYVNAYELGTKNTLFGGALVLNGAAFYYDYTDYQISKIVDRSAVNENFDAEVWGLELETIFAPSLSWQFNAAIGFLQTEIAEGEESIDLMDRTQGDNRHFANPDSENYPEGFDEWMVLKANPVFPSNCIVPTELIGRAILDGEVDLFKFCPGGGLGGTPAPYGYDPLTDAPNSAAGFMADLGGNELPNSPEFTFAVGGQYNFDLASEWQATARVDYYWQDKSWARVYNTEYDRLKSWSNTNLSFWMTNPQWGVTVEAYVKNVFDEAPITGAFLNSDDTGLTTNVFTLDPRLIGVSIRKEF